MPTLCVIMPLLNLVLSDIAQDEDRVVAED